MRDSKHSSNFSMSKNSSKISFVVRKNNKLNFSKDEFKREGSFAADSDTN